MAFERLKAFFRKGGIFTDSLNSPADHPKIGTDYEEYARIQQNMQVYACRYEPIKYYNASGTLCQRRFTPLNVVKFASSWMATLLFNDKCRINIAEPTARNFITELFEQNNFSQNFQQYLEVMYAVGGLAIRPYYAGSSGKIKLSWVLPDRFFPLESNTGEVAEGAFLSKTRITKGKAVLYYSLFEFHEWNDDLYTIHYELYESNKANVIGKQVPLGTLDKYASLEPCTVLTGLSRSGFVYLKPATMNNLAPDSPLGLGMCDNAAYTIETINVLHDKFRRNIDRSRSAVAIDPEYIETQMEDGRIRQLHDEDDLFLAIPGKLDNAPFEEISIEIKPDQYITSINFELRTFEMLTGFSPGTFVFEAKGLKTATEVVSEDSMTYQTRNRQVVVLESAIRDLVHSILELAAAVGLYSGQLQPAVTVDFDDGVFQDKSSQLDYYGRAVNYKLIPRSEAIKRAFNLTAADADAWLEAIQNEEAEKLAGVTRLRDDLAFGVPGAEK